MENGSVAAAAMGTPVRLAAENGYLRRETRQPTLPKSSCYPLRTPSALREG